MTSGSFRRRLTSRSEVKARRAGRSQNLPLLYAGLTR
jgi:hypothetical protein